MDANSEDNFKVNIRDLKMICGSTTVNKIKNIFCISKPIEIIKWNTTACSGDSLNTVNGNLPTIGSLAKKQFFRNAVLENASDYFTSKAIFHRNNNIISSYVRSDGNQIVDGIAEKLLKITSRTFEFQTSTDILKMFLNLTKKRHLDPNSSNVLALLNGCVSNDEEINKLDASTYYLQGVNAEDNIYSVLLEDAPTQIQTANLKPNEYRHKGHDVAVARKFSPIGLCIRFDNNVLNHTMTKLSKLVDSDNLSNVELLKVVNIQPSNEFWDTPKLSTRKMATPKRLNISKTYVDSTAVLSDKEHSLLLTNDDDHNGNESEINVGSSSTIILLKEEYSIVIPNHEKNESNTVNISLADVGSFSAMSLFEERSLVILTDDENDLKNVEATHNNLRKTVATQHENKIIPEELVNIHEDSKINVLFDRDSLNAMYENKTKSNLSDDLPNTFVSSNKPSQLSFSPIYQLDNSLEESLRNENFDLNIGYYQVPEPPWSNIETRKETFKQAKAHTLNSRYRTIMQNQNPTILQKHKTVLTNNSGTKQRCSFKILPKSLASRNKPNFKNVVSPVGMYIKHSPRVPQVKRIYIKAKENRPLFANIATKIIKENKENEEVSLPNRLYKPAKHTVIAKDSEQKFPKKIQELIKTTPKVVKHKGRIYKKKSDLNSVEEKLLKEDLTMNYSDGGVANFSTSSLQDVSVLSTKNAYIK